MAGAMVSSRGSGDDVIGISRNPDGSMEDESDACRGPGFFVRRESSITGGSIRVWFGDIAISVIVVV